MQVFTATLNAGVNYVILLAECVNYVKVFWATFVIDNLMLLIQHINFAFSFPFLQQYFVCTDVEFDKKIN